EGQLANLIEAASTQVGGVDQRRVAGLGEIHLEYDNVPASPGVKTIGRSRQREGVGERVCREINGARRRGQNRPSFIRDFAADIAAVNQRRGQRRIQLGDERILVSPPYALIGGGGELKIAGSRVTGDVDIPLRVHIDSGAGVRIAAAEV